MDGGMLEEYMDDNENMDEQLSIETDNKEQ